MTWKESTVKRLHREAFRPRALAAGIGLDIAAHIVLVLDFGSWSRFPLVLAGYAAALALLAISWRAVWLLVIFSAMRLIYQAPQLPARAVALVLTLGALTCYWVVIKTSRRFIKAGAEPSVGENVRRPST